MAAPLIDSTTFIPNGGGGQGLYSHKISQGTLTDSEKLWFRKEMESPADARSEALAQEFFRLLIPRQPETFLAWDETLGTYYILSEAVPGFRFLPENQKERFTRGDFPGLGQIVIGSIFLFEIDLKNGNLVLNENNEVVKIDGDWSFAGIKCPEKFGNKPNKITPELIASLPYPLGFYTFNWFGMVEKGVAKLTSKFVNPADLSKAPHFREEMNQAMLKILLLPDSYITQFVDAFIPAGADRYTEFMRKHRDQLKASALQNASFRAYLLSDNALTDAVEHLEHIQKFTVQGNTRIVSEVDAEKLKSEYKTLWDALRGEALIVSTDPTVEHAEGIFSPVGSGQQENSSLYSRMANGFSRGFLAAAACTLALILLRVIDVLAFNLSVTLTVAAGAGIVLTVGVLVGILGAALQYFLAESISTDTTSEPMNDNEHSLEDDLVQDLEDFNAVSKAIDYRHQGGTTKEFSPKLTKIDELDNNEPTRGLIF
jgi:hypothetical protein